MQRIGTPLQTPDLRLEPEFTGGIKLSEDMQQTLALIAGYWRNKRIPIRSTPTGALFVTTAELADIEHITADQANYTWQGGDKPVSEIMVMGHPNNAGTVWIAKGKTATTSNGWPLDAKEVLNISVTNMNMLHLLIEANTEKAIIAYTM